MEVFLQCLQNPRTDVIVGTSQDAPHTTKDREETIAEGCSLVQDKGKGKLADITKKEQSYKMKADPLLTKTTLAIEAN